MSPIQRMSAVDGDKKKSKEIIDLQSCNWGR